VTLTVATQPAQLRAEIDRVSYRNEENGWTVVRAKNCDDDSVFVATGHFAAVHPGEQFELIGSWGKHAQYGMQFRIDRMVPVRPTGEPAIERYLASGLIKGIGPKTAHLIVKQFGERTLEILDANPKRLLEVPSVGAKKAEAIIGSWSEQRGVADVMMFLNTHGVSPLFASRIFKTYGPEAVKIVSADPYRLATDIHGIGFVSADKIARSMGIAADSIERLRAATLYTMQQAEDRGHCYVTSEQLAGMLVETLQLPEDRVSDRLEKVLTQLNETGAVVTERVPNGPDKDLVRAHFRSDLLVCEWNVAHAVNRLLTTPMATDQERVSAWITRYTEASGTELTDEQLDAVRKAAEHRVFILTGGPGVGKTTTANAIIRLLKAMGKSVALAAPTGRAAQRLTEVAGTPAKTIHRTLEWLPHQGGFARDEHSPLPVGAVVVDEASMLDIRLADALFRAVDPKAQLILIGDVDQLPSVGPGNVLRDLIDSGRVPYTRLKRIFRQAATSRIVRSAHAINEGEMPDFGEAEGAAGLTETGAAMANDCQFLDAPSAEDIKATLRELITRKIPRETGLDPVRDVQVLTPMNRGELGTQVLNEELQALLNPPRPAATLGGAPARDWKRGNVTLRKGDKVIQVVNNYDLGVFNGDIGFVKETHVEGGRVHVAFGDDRVVAYEDEDAMDLRLAYAITIHKSQGSEFPAVIIPSSMAHYVMLQRNLVYTALTRARKLALFIGAKKALAFAVGNATGTVRQTSLVDKLTRAAERT
jgi:exodeoxyribonuclease V alpha subunit